MAESRLQDTERLATGGASRPGLRQLLPLLALFWGGCDGNVGGELQAPAVLALVDTTVITEADFDAALPQWEDDGTAGATAAQWQRRLQLLIDRRLLVLEALELGFYDDPKVLREVELWQRSRVIAELLEIEAREVGQFTEEELHEFYYGSGANREVLVGRLVLGDSARAAAALSNLRAQVPFSEVVEAYAGTAPPGSVDSVWLSGLALGDDRLESLLSRWVGDAELLAQNGRYLVVAVLAERSVALEERRRLAEHALRREREEEANLAYLASLMQKYDVYVDSVALRRLGAAGGTGRSDPNLRLVRSSLGDWTAAQYREAISRLSPGQRPVPGDLGDLYLQVLRTFAVDQLLSREVTAKGLGPELARRQRTVREQKAIEALWAAKGLARITVSEMELRRYFEANRDRYLLDFGMSTTPASLRARVLQDLKEELAAPLFDEYVAELRRRFRPRVSVDVTLFRAYVARKTGSPALPSALNGCEPLSAVDATGRSQVQIHFGRELGYAYQPRCASVSTGTAVTFIGDFAAHPMVPGRVDDREVVANRASPLRPTAAGGEMTFLLAEAGAYGYFCDQHVADAMMGAIFVE